MVGDGFKVAMKPSWADIRVTFSGPSWPVLRAVGRCSIAGDAPSWKLFEYQCDGETTRVLRVVASCTTFAALAAACRLLGPEATCDT